MKKPFALLCTTFISIYIICQPSIDWQVSLGGSDWDGSRSVVETNDGGYLIAGSTDSNDGDVVGHNGDRDIWVVKLNASGGMDWSKTYGGSEWESEFDIIQTLDGGYAFIGSTYSSDGDVSSNYGESDLWIVKLDVNGNIEWEETYGGSDIDYPWSIIQSSDDGFVVVGESNSSDGDVTDNQGQSDLWMIKTNSVGALEWQRSVGGSQYDYARDVVELDNGNFALLGTTGSSDGDIAVNHGLDDIWLLMFSDQGTFLWEKTFGGSNTDWASSIIQTTDGGLVFSGSVESDDGDVSDHIGWVDYWVVKSDTNGIIQWEHCFGGSDGEFAGEIIQTPDGGYSVGGSARSNDGDVSGNNGGFGDTWVIRIDDQGSLLWQKAMGGSDADGSYGIQLTSDGGYILAGGSDSDDGDVSGNHGNFDTWVIKLSSDPVGLLEYDELNAIQAYPNPTSNVIHFDLDNGFGSYLNYEIIDAMGRVQLTGRLDGSFNRYTIDLSGLSSGSYHLKLIDREFMYAGHFLKL